MAINIQAKNDYSYLFSSLGTSSSSGSSISNLNFLSDYASIKNGSYYKLMKAYYNETGNASELVNKTSTNNSTSKDSTESLAEVQKSTDSLKESADALLVSGSKSVFSEKEITTKDENGVESTTKGYDTDAIYKAVNNFVTDYNSVIESTATSNTTSIASRSTGLITATAANAKLLEKVGITINEDYSLSIDEDTFKKADMNTVKSLFSGNGSFAYRVSAQASLINFAADNEASKANTYTFDGTYSNTYSSGNLFNSFL